jgi:hypothetical protein
MVENRGKLLQFVEVSGNQLVQSPLPLAGKPDPDDPPVVWILPPIDQPGCSGPVDELLLPIAALAVLIRTPAPVALPARRTS